MFLFGRTSDAYCLVCTGVLEEGRDRGREGGMGDVCRALTRLRAIMDGENERKRRQKEKTHSND